ncbi:hypothetical protein EHI47_12355 [Rhizobium leguminosarum]|uniref:Uncharacterized protein n=1 Tax=Rhizobium leguminosarum TaxID=384 RepID=A0A444I3A6_RHILE|nr:hypothetical protein [Rhizobium leguminosarum]RWX31828.1 hypothetical protein EHI47_12355 [Rhizobium leguminosarum]
MNIDGLKRFAPGGKPVILAGLSATSDDLYEAGIDTPPRICHFMAQIAHMSTRTTSVRSPSALTAPSAFLTVLLLVDWDRIQNSGPAFLRHGFR